MDNIFDLKEIRNELDSEEWENDFYGTQSRRIYIGTVFNVMPSGKYYMPWACSNLDPCPTCNGSGFIPGHHKNRVCKKNHSRYEKMNNLAMKRGRKYAIKHYSLRDKAKNRWQLVCPTCCGLGSKEAYDDESWTMQAEEELSQIGCSLESGEGDPCDLFIVECRDEPEEEFDEAV